MQRTQCPAFVQHYPQWAKWRPVIKLEWTDNEVDTVRVGVELTKQCRQIEVNIYTNIS